jgi:hypothetical protein
VLDAPEISVVAVIGGKPVGDSDESRFSFKLNHTVCPIWLHLFQENLGDYPRALIENTTLSFDCSPNDLKAQFGKVKETIKKTNTDYKNFRGEVIVQFQ